MSISDVSSEEYQRSLDEEYSMEFKKGLPISGVYAILLLVSYHSIVHLIAHIGQYQYSKYQKLTFVETKCFLEGFNITEETCSLPDLSSEDCAKCKCYDGELQARYRIANGSLIKSIIRNNHSMLQTEKNKLH
jgi:hypothetical protein